MHYSCFMKTLDSNPRQDLADMMRLETTITDQILLTFGVGDHRSVLKLWHVSERKKAEQYLENLRNPRTSGDCE